MRGIVVGKRAALLLAAWGLAIALLGSGRGKAQPTDELGAGVAEARALVAQLEGQLRATAANLQKAKELLAQLEGAETPAPKAGPKKDADGVEDQTSLVEGVWRIVGINGHESGMFQNPPYDEYKIMSAGHYFWLSFDPDSGKVLRSGGGVYSIKDGTYTGSIECSNSDDLRASIGQEYKGTFKLDGKKWYHFGHVPNGAVFDELWVRVH
jgi:hypothetical protein